MGADCAAVMVCAGVIAERDIIQGYGPVHWMICAGLDLKGAAVGGD